MKDSIYCDVRNCRSNDATHAMTVSATGGPYMRMTPVFDRALCEKHYNSLMKVLEKGLGKK